MQTDDSGRAHLGHGVIFSWPAWALPASLFACSLRLACARVCQGWRAAQQRPVAGRLPRTREFDRSMSNLLPEIIMLQRGLHRSCIGAAVTVSTLSPNHQSGSHRSTDA
jgi:hypothetical protein